MANYAEELAYWYLRLNGFFLIENFVIHRSNGDVQGIKYRSDADLLAVRFPGVIEVLGEKTLECDTDFLFKKFNSSKIIGLVVEVKSGEDWKELKIFEDMDRMTYALRRLGFLNGEMIEELASEESWTIVDIDRDFQVGKLLVHDLKNIPEKYEGKVVPVKLTTVKEFIEKRFRDNKVEKFMSRLFFPSSLIQSMAWERYRKLSPNP